MKKQSAACVNVDLTNGINELRLENNELESENHEYNHAAELAVPEICWQMHEPLYLSSIE